MKQADEIRNNPIIQAIRSRRVTRHFSDQPLTQEILETIVEAARWAPSGGNRRLHKFVVVVDPRPFRTYALLHQGSIAIRWQ